MGNRSITYFYDGEFSPGVYTQWSGGKVFFWVKQANIRTGSASGSAARYAAMCCKKMPGNLSVYLYGPPSKEQQHAMKALLKEPSNRAAAMVIDDEGPGDNGTYIVDVRNLYKTGIRVFQVSRYFENLKTQKEFLTGESKKGSEYLERPECRFLGSFPAPEDNYGDKLKKISRTKVESSSINSFAVSQRGHFLIEFKNGTVYRYYNVDRFTVREFERAESKGKYFSSHIKNFFPYKKVNKLPATFKD